MTVDENVKKAMGRIDRYLAGWRICQTPWQIIRTRLIELEALLADYENANKHSADDCVAKDGEDYAAIDRVAHVLQEVIAENDGEPSEMAHDQMRRILAAYAAPSAPTENAGVPDSVIVLLNHLETLMDEGKLAEDAIPTEMWNAVSMHNLVAAPSAPEGE